MSLLTHELSENMKNNILIKIYRKVCGQITSERNNSTSPLERSPFFHYNSRFDAIQTIHNHAVKNIVPDQNYLTNYLGVKVDPKYFPGLLDNKHGEVEPAPIPANWHADIAEFAAALRAVELSNNTFRVIELGCGWGCWLNNTGIAAKRLGREVELIGVEGDKGHIEFAIESTSINGFRQDEVNLLHGIASSEAGTALFPVQDQPGVEWGLEPIFGATPEEMHTLTQSGKFQALPMLSLIDIVQKYDRIDLLHIDIQGGELDLLETCASALKDYVAYILVGTHSRSIEGRLFDIMLKDKWLLEIERPALLNVETENPIVTVDGVQGWRNTNLT